MQCKQGLPAAIASTGPVTLLLVPLGLPHRLDYRSAPLPVHIRWMIRRDMPEVLAIEKHCFEFPWQDEDFIRCLRQRNCIGMVAEAGERVVGFMIYELHKSRLHILNFAVHEGYRHRG